MNILHYFCIVLCLHSSFSFGLFSYDFAVYAAQKGDMQAADETLQKIIINSPDNADVLYDVGVVAHNLNNGAQAAAYFTRAAEYAHDDDNLRFQAHFNAGTTCVDTKKLQEALMHFDKALEIKPDDQYARHNRDRVAQMLQEQEQQKNQQRHDDQKKDQDQDQKKDQQQNNDQSNNGDNNQKENDGNDQQQSGDDGNQQQNQKNKSSSDQSDEKSDEKSQGEQGNDSEKDDRGTQGKNKNRDTQKRQQDSADKQEGNGKQDLEKDSKRAQQEREKQHGKQHEKTPEKQNRPQDKTNATSADTQEKGIDDPWLMRILDEREQNDKALNKQLMEAKVRQHGGKNGKNCW